MDFQNTAHDLVMLILKDKDLSGMTTADVVALYHKILKEVKDSWTDSMKAVYPEKATVIRRI